MSKGETKNNQPITWANLRSNWVQFVLSYLAKPYHVSGQKQRRLSILSLLLQLLHKWKTEGLKLSRTQIILCQRSEQSGKSTVSTLMMHDACQQWTWLWPVFFFFPLSLFCSFVSVFLALLKFRFIIITVVKKQTTVKSEDVAPTSCKPKDVVVVYDVHTTWNVVTDLCRKIIHAVTIGVTEDTNQVVRRTKSTRNVSAQYTGMSTLARPPEILGHIRAPRTGPHSFTSAEDTWNWIFVPTAKLETDWFSRYGLFFLAALQSTNDSK